MNTNFISIQGSYKHFEIALFKNLEHIESVIQKGSDSSSKFITTLDAILNRNSTQLKDISFIAVNQGPGASTSLRVIMSFVNAISLASNIPLIGVDGLEALANECFRLTKQKSSMLVSLLNAFNNEAFFAIYKIEKNKLELQEETGYLKLESLLDKIKSKYPNQKILFCGNAADAYQKEIFDVLNNTATIDSNLPLVSSAKEIGLISLNYWNKKQNISTKLLPTYLKIQNYKPKYS